MKRTRKPTHPGTILYAEVVEPLGLTVSGFAKNLGVSRKTLSKILNERGGVTPEMALRLSRALDTTPDVWLNLQKSYDLWMIEHTSDDWKSATPLRRNDAPDGDATNAD
jgi:addiction module HigA family antidote